MRIFVWLLRLLAFLVMFGFALNNREPVIVHGFFGARWPVPLVAVLLMAFGAGCALGVTAMLPSWWRRRAATAGESGAPRTNTPDVVEARPSSFAPTHPPRDGV